MKAFVGNMHRQLKSAGLTGIAVVSSLFAVVALSAVPMAFAAVPLQLEDGFNYTDTDVSSASLDLDYVDGTLVFELGNGGAGALPAVAVDGYPVFDDDDDVPADAYLAAEIDGVELDVRAGTLHSVRVEHQAESLSAVIDAYVDVLGGLGFEASHESSSGNVEVYTFVNGEGSLRAVFTPTAAGGRAYLATL